jgi:hypothetical protein
MGCDSALLLMQQKRSKLVFLRVAWIIDDGIGGGAKGVPQSRLGYWGIGRGKCPSSLSLLSLVFSLARCVLDSLQVSSRLLREMIAALEGLTSSQE